MTYDAILPVETTLNLSYSVTSSGIFSANLVVEGLGYYNQLFEREGIQNESDEISLLVGPGRFRITVETSDYWLYSGQHQSSASSVDVTLDWVLTPHETDRQLDWLAFKSSTIDAVYWSWQAFEHEGSLTAGLYLSRDRLFDADDVPIEVRDYAATGALGSWYDIDLPYLLRNRGYGTYATQYDDFYYSIDEAAIEDRPYLLLKVDPHNTIQERVEYEATAWALRPVVNPIGMTYGGTAADILPDPGSGADSYAGPHYVDDNADGVAETQAPVLYVAGDTLTLESITFQREGNFTGDVLLRGDGPDGLDFAPQYAARFGEELRVYDWASTALPTHVFRDREFTIEWSYSVDGGLTWLDAGVTQTPLYVAAAAPATDQLYETVVDIAVRNAEGLSAASPSGLIDAIWSDFEDDKYVPTVEGLPIFYYSRNSPGEEGGRTTAEVLERRIADCTGMVPLLLDTLAVHGVTGGFAVEVRPLDRSEGVVVNDANFAPAGSRFFQSSAYHLNGKINGVPQVEWNAPAVRQAIGPSTPSGVFGFHYLAMVDGQFYDPSYGRVYDDLATYEASAIGAFERMGKVNAVYTHPVFGPQRVEGRLGRPNGPETDIEAVFRPHSYAAPALIQESQAAVGFAGKAKASLAEASPIASLGGAFAGPNEAERFEAFEGLQPSPASPPQPRDELLFIDQIAAPDPEEIGSPAAAFEMAIEDLAGDDEPRAVAIDRPTWGEL